MTRILVIRHGFSLSNATRCYTGQTDVGLSPLGYEQAERVADYLCANEQVDAIYSSDLSRAMDTVRPTAKRLGLEVIPVRALRETDVGALTGRSYEECQHVFGKELARHRTDPAFPLPNGESWVDVFARVTDALVHIARENEGKCVVIATHAGAARAIACFAAGYALHDISKLHTAPNASIHPYRFENGKLISEGRNIVSHLEKEGEKLPDELL